MEIDDSSGLTISNNMVDRLATVLWFVLKMFQIIIHRLHIWPLRRIVQVSQSVSQYWSLVRSRVLHSRSQITCLEVCCYGIDLGTSIVRFNQSEQSIWSDLDQ